MDDIPSAVIPPQSPSPGARAPGLFLFTPMHPDLDRVIALQKIDSAAHEAQRQLDQEPDRQKALERRLEAARQSVTAAKDRLTGSQNDRRAIEKDLAVHQGRLSKFREQLMSVKTNIEYQAMQKEIGFAQSEVRALEDRILERMLEADELSSEVKKTEAALVAEQKDVDKEQQAMTNEMARLRASMTDLVSHRQQIVGQLDGRVLAMFDLVSKRRHGVAVAEARDGICTICHVRLRPQVFNNVRLNNDIVQCDSCQRILYFVPLAPAAAADASPSTS